MTTIDFVLVAPSPDDVEAMDAMWAQSWLDTYPNETFGVSREQIKTKVSRMISQEAHAKRRKQVAEAKSNSDTFWRIAKSKGKIIGLTAAYRADGKQHMGALYVDKAYHGKGVAQALMREVMLWIDPTQPIELEVATYNDRAKAFYRKYGFEEIAGSEHQLHETIPVIKMIRKGDKQ